MVFFLAMIAGLLGSAVCAMELSLIEGQKMVSLTTIENMKTFAALNKYTDLKAITIDIDPICMKQAAQEVYGISDAGARTNKHWTKLKQNDLTGYNEIGQAYIQYFSNPRDTCFECNKHCIQDKDRELFFIAQRNIVMQYIKYYQGFTCVASFFTVLFGAFGIWLTVGKCA
jgi:hypothetical protein